MDNRRLNDQEWYVRCVQEKGTKIDPRICLFNSGLRDDYNAINYFMKISTLSYVDKYTSALEGAIVNNNLDMVDYLTNEIGVNLRDSSDIGLIISSKYGNNDMINYFLEKGGTNLLGAINEAVINGQLNAVILLINILSDLKLEAFYIAARSNQINILDYLVKQGNIINSLYYVRALSEAIISSSLQTIAYLIPVVVKHGLINNDDYNHLFELAITQNKPDIVNFLYQNKKFDVRELNKFLITAARRGNVDIVKYLISKGANNFALVINLIKPDNPTYRIIQARVEENALINSLSTGLSGLKF